MLVCVCVCMCVCPPDSVIYRIAFEENLQYFHTIATSVLSTTCKEQLAIATLLSLMTASHATVNRGLALCQLEILEDFFHNMNCIPPKSCSITMEKVNDKPSDLKTC